MPFRGNPGTRVDHMDGDLLGLQSLRSLLDLRYNAFEPDEEFPSWCVYASHCLCRIDHQIEQRLFHERGVYARNRCSRGEVGAQCDLLEQALRTVKVDEFFDDLAEIALDGREFDAAGEAQKVVKDIGEPGRFTTDGFYSADKHQTFIFGKRRFADRLTRKLYVQTNR